MLYYYLILIDRQSNMKENLTFLGIETSCDETAASVVREKNDGTGEILSNIVSSQVEEHKEFGGVVPEIAARAHVEKIEFIIKKAINESGIKLEDLNAVAATAGPGLIVCLSVGLSFGKSLASSLNKPFIAVNCGAIPHELLEGELFGYEKGSFTGAINTRIGRMELANQGTIFFDEIGDMPTSLQVKLLRVLAEREIDRIGSTKPTPIDIRVITATHRNLEESIKEGSFREDLFYRLNIIPINLPPLRERKTDIPLLADHFLKQFNSTAIPKTISDEAMQFLVNYSWPGNIRELANFIERMVVLSIGSTITPRDLPEKVLGDTPKEKWQPLEEDKEGNPEQIDRKSVV